MGWALISYNNTPLQNAVRFNTTAASNSIIYTKLNKNLSDSVDQNVRKCTTHCTIHEFYLFSSLNIQTSQNMN